MGFKNFMGKLGYKSAKEAARIVAPIAALASTAGAGGEGYLDNVAAVYNAPRQLYEFGKAFVGNEGVRDFTINRLVDLGSLVGQTAENIAERPLETALAAAGVYATVRFTPHLVKGITKAVKGIRGRTQAGTTA